MLAVTQVLPAAKAVDQMASSMHYMSAPAQDAVEEMLGEEDEEPDTLLKKPMGGQVGCIVLALKEHSSKPRATMPTAGSPKRSAKDVLGTLVAAWVVSAAGMFAIVTTVTYVRKSSSQRTLAPAVTTELSSRTARV